ncbi:MAG: hypothetical protein M1827_007263 [Pycnora praestabilis]|nr:MAG: hypothetical protein M1827_007263 [Pycnora praestabilis]
MHFPKLTLLLLIASFLLVLPLTSAVTIRFRGWLDLGPGLYPLSFQQWCRSIPPGVCCLPLIRRDSFEVVYDPTEVRIQGLPTEAVGSAWEALPGKVTCGGRILDSGPGRDGTWQSATYSQSVLESARWDSSVSALKEGLKVKSFRYPDLMTIEGGSMEPVSGTRDQVQFASKNRGLSLHWYAPDVYKRSVTGTRYCAGPQDCEGFRCVDASVQPKRVMFGTILLASIKTCLP